MQYDNIGAARAIPAASPARRATVIPLPVKKQRTKTKARSRSQTRAGVRFATVAAVFVFFVGAWSFNLFTRAQICDVKDQIAVCDESIKSLESESVSLEMQLENKVSFDNLESGAKELGMVKRSDSQVKYISTQSEDKAQIISDKK